MIKSVSEYFFFVNFIKIFIKKYIILNDIIQNYMILY